MHLEPIPDHLEVGLKILFVGFNPSIRSSETGYHYANPTNRFWKILHEAGLTPRKFAPHENQELLELGFGLTNIVERPTREAADISKEEYAEGAVLLREKIEAYQPNAVCFVGKGVYKEYSRKRKIGWGVQEDPVVTGTIEFVAPSSSGLVRIPLDDIVDVYRALNKYL
ncbi:TDG/mug DNA glycosylase family protein [Planomicrobium koreense]|uniref:TDG/mug DNA glycosylase family protein n=1 Tax=Planococcus koreensis TaxID=112331 RepID=A0A7W8FTT7_9BACL|nr:MULTISPECIES: G/U mismatch-specific DNA glycosylase [Planococcus]MBB5179860.1 TDG/mug DNA glycosylase family protein [Planococcus koreensis]MDN3451767.1 G/U mismatch-specific DNA glycosylase [Planococcus sp. APC 3906]